MKKILMFLLLGVFLIGMVSAYEFDNVESYDENIKTATIINAFNIPLLRETIATLKLDTPTINRVGLGYQRVAEVTIDNKGQYDNALDKLEFYNIKTGMNKFERDFDYKYKTTEEYLVQVTQEDCINKLKNGSCGIKFVTEERTKGVWKDTGKDLPEGNITIGIYTNVERGDHVEWIPTWYGKKIDEWAIWEENLNEDLGLYYNFSSATESISGVYNLVDYEGTGDYQSSNCLIGDCIHIVNNNYVNVPATMYTSMSINSTTNMWFRTANYNNWNFLWSWEDADGYQLSAQATTKLDLAPSLWTSASGLLTNTWYMFTLVRNDTGLKIYLNGTHVGNKNTPTFDVAENPLYLGGHSGKSDGYEPDDAYFDELGIWNRSLTDSEISGLFNEGAGLSYSETPLPVTILYPIDSDTYSSVSGDLNYSIRGFPAPDRCWYSTDFGLINSTPTVPAYTNFTGITATEGSNTWTVYCNNTLGTENGTTTFEIDILAPTINITHPNGIVGYYSSGANLSINWSIAEGNIDSCWYEYGGVNTSISDEFCTAVNSTIFNVTSYGEGTIIFFVNDTLGKVGEVTSTWVFGVFERSQNHTSPVQSGGNSNFTLNISYDSSTYTNSLAYLNYNHTRYTTTKTGIGDNLVFSKVMTAPIVTVETQNPFLWEIVLNDGSDNFFNSTQLTQNITAVGIDNCSTYGSVLYNFTVVDEETQNKLTGTTENVTSEVNIQLYTLTGILITSYFTSFNTTNPFPICINSNLTGGESYKIDTQVQYTATQYAREFYHIQKDTIDASDLNTSITLYDLISSNAQEFKITYKDENFLGVPDALIQIQRRYVGEGVFRTVEIPKTDTNGEAVANLETNDVIYTIIVVKNGEILSTFNNIQAVCDNVLTGDCEINLNDFSSFIETRDYSTSDDFSFTQTWNKTERKLEVIYSVLSGTVETVSLNGTKYDALGTTEACNNVLTSSSGTLTCTVPDSFGNSTVIFKIYSGGDQKGEIITSLGDEASDIYGTNQVFLALILMLTLIGVGISDNPMITGIFLLLGSILAVILNIFDSSGFTGAGATILWLIIAIILVLIKGAKRG